MKHKSTQTNSDKNNIIPFLKDEFSYSKGISLVFDVDGIDVKWWLSIISGLEIIYINGEIAMRKRKFSMMKITHKFKYGGDNYLASLEVKSILKYKVYCSLSKNGQLVGKKIMQNSGFRNLNKNHPIYIDLLLYFTIFASYSILKKILYLPESSISAVIYLILAVFAYRLFVVIKNSKPKIRDVTTTGDDEF